jgi:hypothetical protein
MWLLWNESLLHLLAGDAPGVELRVVDLVDVWNTPGWVHF